MHRGLSNIPSVHAPSHYVGLSRLMAVVLFAVMASSCESSPRVCTETPMAPAAEEDLATAVARLSFEPVRPCARSGGFTVSSVHVDVLPRGRGEPRISFIAAARGREAFVWSQTRDQVPFSAIPAGTHVVTVAVGETVARGFAGPSGTGADTAYVRWRDAEITYELSATLRPWFTERAFLDLAHGLMRLVAPQP